VSKDDPLALIILLTLFFGLRRSEVLGLKWDAINYEDKTMIIKVVVVKIGKKTYIKDLPKSDSSYAIIPLSDIIIAELIKWKQVQEERQKMQPNDYINNDYICTMFNGAHMKPSYISQHFQVLLHDFDELFKHHGIISRKNVKHTWHKS